MKKFSCTLCFNFNQHELASILKESLNALGFSPEVIYVNSEESSADVSYAEGELFGLIEKGFLVIQILNKNYDESEDYYWFRVTSDKDYNVLKLEWHNSNLDFLLTSHSMSAFLSNPNFICGNCCDNGDRYEQSKEDNEYFINTDPKDPYKIEKIVERFDLSKHWGRSENTCSLEFMAAPIMWFGERFYKIILKEKLLEFKYSNLITVEGVELVCVNLFDIYDSPAKALNREKQEEFWKFFDLENVIAKYKSENEIDPIQTIKDIIAKARKKKK